MIIIGKFNFGENNFLSFIHTRLSILDINTKGRQPFFIKTVALFLMEKYTTI